MLLVSVLTAHPSSLPPQDCRHGSSVHRGCLRLLHRSCSGGTEEGVFVSRGPHLLRFERHGYDAFREFLCGGVCLHFPAGGEQGGRESE